MCVICIYSNILMYNQMMSVSFDSNTTSGTNGARTTYPSRAPLILMGFMMLNICSCIESFYHNNYLSCRPVSLAIRQPVYHRFMKSYYPFSMFKRFLQANLVLSLNLCRTTEFCSFLFYCQYNRPSGGCWNRVICNNN